MGHDFIYDSAAAPVGNVYNNWDLLYTDAIQVSGVRRIYLNSDMLQDASSCLQANYDLDGGVIPDGEWSFHSVSNILGTNGMSYGNQITFQDVKWTRGYVTLRFHNTRILIDSERDTSGIHSRPGLVHHKYLQLDNCLVEAQSGSCFVEHDKQNFTTLLTAALNNSKLSGGGSGKHAIDSQGGAQVEIVSESSDLSQTACIGGAFDASNGLIVNLNGGTIPFGVNAACPWTHVPANTCVMLTQDKDNETVVTFNTSQNDLGIFNVSGLDLLHLNPQAAGLSVTGIRRPGSSGSDRGKGRFALVNATSFPVTIPNNSASSSVGNRILTPGGVPFSLTQNLVRELIYDQSVSVYRFIG